MLPRETGRTLSLSLCGAERGTLLLAPGTEPCSRAGMHWLPHLPVSHHQSHTFGHQKSAF